MPLYEFQNKETGESVGELYLSLEARDDFLEMNPKLCVRPGKLRLAIHKSEDSFPSNPDMNQETRTPEERGSDYKPPLPSSWVDSDEESGKTGIKITDKRKVKINHFEEDIKKYGKITGTPKAVGLPSSGTLYNSVDSDQPGSAREQQELDDIMSKVDEVGLQINLFISMIRSIAILGRKVLLKRTSIVMKTLILVAIKLGYKET